jgi:hypothetical protein
MTPQFGASLTDNSIVIIYDRNMFMIEIEILFQSSLQSSSFRSSILHQDPPLITDYLWDWRNCVSATASKSARIGATTLGITAFRITTLSMTTILYVMLTQRSQVRKCLLKSQMRVYIQRNIG